MITEGKKQFVNLNPVQMQAVLHTEGPLLVLAGAGTGKTMVLINRILHILKEGKAQAHEILATTFTNKAASEMQERIFREIPHKIHWLGTFHSIAAKILRIHGSVLNLSETFSILDVDDQHRLLKSIVSDLDLDAKQYDPKIVGSVIQKWKDQALSPSQVTNSDLKSEFHRVTLRIYKVYQEKLTAMDSVDFGDLLLKNIEIFKMKPDLLESYQEKFKYIMVDEYQDTNTSQYIWLRMLAQGRHNICCVGDDDQSIYSWRGARVGNILRFEEDFTNARLIKLEQNYRSTQHILKAASTLISNNTMRHDKTLWTDQQSNQKILIKACWSDKEEGQFIAHQILMSRSINSSSKTAVLVRALFQTRIIEECLINSLIPYKVIGSLKFYERQEIKDILAYLKLTMKINDDLSFERIINKPTRSIGASSLQKIKDFARDHHISLFSASEMMVGTGVLGAKARSSLSAFIDLIKTWQSELSSINHVELVKNIIDQSGYKQMLMEDKLESTNRLENLKELVKALEDFNSISSFLEHISLMSDTDKKATEDNVVSVMSLHAAKGLEFDRVFLSGWEEGLFPHSKTLEEEGTNGLEEERRLAYVGITRAKEKLYISYALSRKMYNQWTNPAPSRFLKELPKESCSVLQ